MDTAINNYQLKAGSPAIDIGTLQSAPNRDLAGTARPSGSGVDIGAYERLAQGTSPGVNVVGGRLLVGGGSGDDVLVITGVGSGTTGQYVVVFNQVSQTVSGVTGNMEIDLYGGNDQVTINNAFVNGTIEIDVESGHDQVTLGSQQIVSTRLTLSVLLGEGNDTLTGQRLYIGTSQSASGGDGNDQMSFLGSAGPGPFVLGTSSGGAASFSGGLGNDRITVTYSFVVGAWQFIGGLNDDTISLRTSACNSAVSVLGDAGVDSLVVDTDYILGTLLIDGGADGDQLDLRNCLGITTATIQGGAGNDTALVISQTLTRLLMYGGTQNDTFEVRNSVLDELYLSLGTEDDTGTVAYTRMRLGATLDGGTGFDELLDLGNLFGSVRRLAFEIVE